MPELQARAQDVLPWILLYRHENMKSTTHVKHVILKDFFFFRVWNSTSGDELSSVVKKKITLHSGLPLTKCDLLEPGDVFFRLTFALWPASARNRMGFWPFSSFRLLFCWQNDNKLEADNNLPSVSILQGLHGPTFLLRRMSCTPGVFPPSLYTK